MLDLHCHILPRLDDGPSTVNDSVKMCVQAVKDGITDIVATPHVFDGRHEVSLERRDIYLDKFNSFLNKRGLPLRLHPGVEVRLVPDLGEHLRVSRKLCINRSRYILIELPQTLPSSLDHELYALQLQGFVPLIAHPERHRCIQNNPDYLLHLVSSGVLTQITAQSLLGHFGEDSRCCAELLVQNRTAHIVASDAHSPVKRPPLLSAARARIEQIASVDEARAMFVDRPRAILNNRSLDTLPPLPTTPRTIPDLIERLATLL